MDKVKITPPEGYEIDKENSTFEEIVFKKKLCLPTKFRDIGRISGYYVNTYSRINKTSEIENTLENRNIFPSKEEAEAMLAVAQLCQLRDAWNESWKPDYTDSSFKYVIHVCKNEITLNCVRTNQYWLTFKTPELRDKFAETFKDLIEQAKLFL